MTLSIIRAERIFDGHRWHEDAALHLDAGRVTDITPAAAAPDAPRAPGWIVPGLVDLQVNGGGGTMLNDAPTPEGIARICAAHAGFGTTATMVTLITDQPEVTRSAIAAAREAAGQPGLLGLHLEGPHFDLRRKGTHEPALIRPMSEDDLITLIEAARALPHLICTLAPEAATTDQIAALAAAGAVVSLGHSDCSHEQARASFDAGARMATHLFNAMSPLTHRAPGLTGAALDDGRVWAGLIADGIHVDDAALRIALRAKAGPGRMFLVSDAMSTIGTDLPGFQLNGRQIFRRDGRLTLADGTLAGADIALIDALRHIHLSLGLPLEDALQLAALFPAQAVGAGDIGHLAPGARADFVALTPEITAAATWIGGRQVAAA
ncbi:N-acetylglucosamine-6-phosphate deacetylase [Paracoccus xiamenensis]|uniref:N-acetylglucosamine-6-phosphate deacetylase n=1 Tax=Paracoccus xiamenensis TaxID=2714901 RepID=UPI001409F44E|nr:N-acetylglucosamine-6-phosphate deacetylase [Paracoccus xiamenensis]NHF73289.1 N-acetylglucosamine-6-phosphate deacetylase [Paracoccus xiamenensis]